MKSGDIKYRCFWKGVKKMVYFTNATFDKNKGSTYGIFIAAEESIYLGAPEVMLFTGYKDKNGNGKDIFEGDVFKQAKGNGVVEMNARKGQWVVKFPSYDFPLAEYIVNDDRREIAGNMYESPELIKE